MVLNTLMGQCFNNLILRLLVSVCDLTCFFADLGASCFLREWINDQMVVSGNCLVGEA